ncbi:MAG TPA: Gfo/Idh/MocA family oxidoreductase [Candidatus Hydrogenedentes bacterium]|nr:Gfo/Idh/MocA family oxidoreductase [Candidatus Hydrogenedentota bacterium]HRT18907.1 Gfo/Idh/MocA family oxidoreductase [Candidatus Hydrogenedentota bacterium]HRT64981.1 Gfo/Idh/MocA family oxidoreductase [Candidatus Hydrogenedentota bacterium]
MEFTRRQFLGATASAALVAGTMGRGTVFGANERIRVACVGIHGRGGSHIDGFSDLPDSEVVALCDVDAHVLEERAAELEKKTGKKPKRFRDMRDLMADKDIDAVSFATPNHWHSLGSVWACQAGKDVYVEKPLSHEVWEGRQLVAAAEKFNRVVMHGTQRRSERDWARAIQRLQEGVIGDIYMARALCFKNRDSIGTGEPKEPPAHLDWPLWQGPAKEEPYCDLYVHYNWHWFWNYGNGDLGNQGVHQMDVAIWGMNKGLPVRIASMGGRFGYTDQGETANTQICTFAYADGTMLVFEVRGRATNDEAGARIGNLFYGSNGYMVDGKFFDKNNKEIPDEKGPGEDITVGGNHYASFIRAVRSRKPEDNPAPARVGHIASAHCHLGNIAYRLGATLTFDPASEQFTGPDAAQANPLLKREYREGFEVPQLA